MNIPIGFGFYESASLPLSHQSCVNLIPVVNEQPALSEMSLFGTPGLELVAESPLIITDTVRTSGIEGFHLFNEKLLFWDETRLFRLDRTVFGSGSETYTIFYTGVTGPLNQDDDKFIISGADNGTYYMAVMYYPEIDDHKGKYWDGTTGGAITDVDFTTTNGNPRRVVYLDGYFIVTTDTNKIKISNLNDPLTWDALDFTSAEADPDGIVAPFVYNNQLFIFGTQTFEIFQNIGGSGFPFVRIPGAVHDVGLKSEEAVVKGRNGLYYLGAGEKESASIYMTAGAKPGRIATDSIDVAIQAKTDTEIGDAYATSYTQEGRYFVTFTIGDLTIVYDEVSSRWHTRKSFFDGAFHAWRPKTVLAAYGHIFAGDSVTGKIGKVRTDIYDEFGETITRQFVPPPLGGEGKSFKLPTVELICESGVGNTDDPDPKVEMEISKDGKTWGSNPRVRRLGKIGEYKKRQIWRRNGRISNFCYLRWTTTAKAKIAFLRAQLVPK